MSKGNMVDIVLYDKEGKEVTTVKVPNLHTRAEAIRWRNRTFIWSKIHNQHREVEVLVILT
jgi:hypothetical protein